MDKTINQGGAAVFTPFQMEIIRVTGEILDLWRFNSSELMSLFGADSVPLLNVYNIRLLEYTPGALKSIFMFEIDGMYFNAGFWIFPKMIYIQSVAVYQNFTPLIKIHCNIN